MECFICFGKTSQENNKHLLTSPYIKDLGWKVHKADNYSNSWQPESFGCICN